MEIIENLILNIIYILFPLLIYLFYVCYKNIYTTKENDLFLGVALFSSLYLTIKFGIINIDNKDLLLFNIPILVAFIKKKHLIAALLSIIVVLYCHYMLGYYVILLIIKYLIYFGIYWFVQKKALSTNIFIGIIAIIQGFFISFEYFFNTKPINDLSILFDILIATILFYVISFLILYLFKITDKFASLYLTLRELEQEKQIKNSLFKITHEIKNPIAVCKGYLDMFDLDNRVKSEKYLPIIKQEINRTLTLMNDFLEFSKIKIDNEIIDINLLLDDIFDSLSLLASGTGVKLEYCPNNEEVYLMGDYNRLKQVFINIVKNSIEAIIKDGVIKINCYQKNKDYVITITDNGTGMDKETLSKIEEPFYTTKEKGTGLGVALSKEIIKAHKGTINYESVLGKGTTVIIKLPIN